MPPSDNDKKGTVKPMLQQPTEGVDMKTALRGNGKGGFQASTTFNGRTYAGEGWNEAEAMSSLRTKVNDAIAEGKFNTQR